MSTASFYTLKRKLKRKTADWSTWLAGPTDTAALETLLPDRWVQAHPDQRLTEREEEPREGQSRRRRKRTARRAAVTAW